MSFGLCNATTTFEILIELVLNGVQKHACLVFLDVKFRISRRQGRYYTAIGEDMEL